MNSTILDELIKEGDRLTSTITYVPPGRNVIRTYSVYRTSEEEIYQNWQSSVQRFIKSYHPSDLEEIKEAAKKLSQDNHRKLLGILKAIKLLPKEPKNGDSKKSGLTNNIHIANSQSNNQQLVLTLFLDAVKDELTGKDLKVIKEIMKDYKAEPETTKNKLLDKIKGFGGDVLSNIVANILTNPNIYNSL